MSHRAIHRIVQSILFIPVASVTLSVFSADASALKPVERQDWLVTLAVGTGRADVDLKITDVQTGWTRGGSAEFTIGRMIGSHFMIGVGVRQWLDEGGLEDYKIRGNIQNRNLFLTVYPGRTTNWTSGMFVQVGAGQAHARLSALKPIEGGPNEWGENYEVVAKLDETGFGLSATVGYEFRISSHFAAGMGISYNYLDFGDEPTFNSAKFYPAAASLTWYF